ncbi:MAG TPA: RNA polymerase sigma factor [Polyangiaceae bacterium]|jgi:RNA polymerase sigma-70 factor (ECF subfamily)|nr:RNA polymerase sigma factor [Polyangiaceae bacterium]
MVASEQQTMFLATQSAAFLTKQPAADLDDAMLASMAAIGDTEAHNAIWDRYSPLVRGIVRRSIGQESEVEDLVQEVFLRFYRNLALLRNPSALRSFIFAISLRVTISELRSRRVRKWLRLSDTGMQPPSTRFIPPADFEAREAVTGLGAILDRLDPKDRTAFVLYHVEGLELTEVAEVLNVSLATIKRRLARIACRVFAMAESDQRLVEYSGRVSRRER